MKNRKLFSRRFFILMAMAAVLATGMLIMTGCGGSGPVSSEPEVIINPITGEESDTELAARPVMVSIPNDTYGAVPQSNISYADIIYEFPVEGEITRLQAVFYSQFPEKVGPIRSVRYYFVDLAREYKAGHVGYGWGKKAHAYMNESKVPHINGMQDAQLFYRADDKSAPNDAYIKWSEIERRADKEGWFDEQKKIRAFKFRDAEWKKARKEAKALIDEKGSSDDPEDVKAVEKAKALVAEPQKATSVSVKTSACSSKCVYNEESKKYDRFWCGESYIDKETGEQMSFSNVLVQCVKSSPMIDENTGGTDVKGRLDIDMCAGGEAMLFTNGEVIKGTWSKKTPDSRTIFKDENGNQFRFSKGTTWVYVLDQNMKLTYE